MSNGLFISLSGIDACGKTTVGKALTKRFEESGRKAVFMGLDYTEIGKQLKQMILSSPKMSAEVEIDLFAAIFQTNWDEEIKRLLEDDVVVIHDRWLLDTWAYQVAYKHSPSNPRYFGQWPDVCFILDIDPKIAAQRMADRCLLDKYDSLNIAEQERIRKCFDTVAGILNGSAGKENSIFAKIDASASVEEITDRIYTAIVNSEEADNNDD